MQYNVERVRKTLKGEQVRNIVEFHFKGSKTRLDRLRDAKRYARNEAVRNPGVTYRIREQQDTNPSEEDHLLYLVTLHVVDNSPSA